MFFPRCASVTIYIGMDEGCTLLRVHYVPPRRLYSHFTKHWSDYLNRSGKYFRHKVHWSVLAPKPSNTSLDVISGLPGGLPVLDIDSMNLSASMQIRRL